MPKPGAKVTSVKDAERKVLYPEVSVDVYQGDKPLTVEIAKDMIGWHEEGEKEKFNDEYDLKDENGKKIRLENNRRNRPFYEAWARQIAQDILNHKFAPEGPNGETVIVGKTGLTISAQHRLVALILASQIWENAEEGSHWKKQWESEPTIETVVVYGISENPETTMTLDNTRSRTFSDSMYTTEVFKSSPAVKREKMLKVMEHAIRFLWDRTGQGDDAYSPYKTNSEQKEFYDRHKTLQRLVKHIYEEDNPVGEGAEKRRVSFYLPVGRAAGLAYLMAASKSDPEVYRKAEVRDEKILDMSMLDKATEFWTLLAGGSGKFTLVHKAIKALDNPETMAKGTLTEKEAIVIKAWEAWSQNKPITEAVLKLKYEGEGDEKMLDERPSVGGIDFLGQEVLDRGENDPSEEEIEAAAMELRKKKQEEAKAKLRAAQGGGGLQPEQNAAASSKEAAKNAGKKPAASPAAPKATPSGNGTAAPAKKPAPKTPTPAAAPAKK